MASDVFGVIAPHPPVMVPAVGRERANITNASNTALQEAAFLLSTFDPDTLVVMSPHSPALRDAFAIDLAESSAGTFEQFGAGQAGSTHTGDPELGEQLLKRLDAADIPAVDRRTAPSLQSGHLDHGVLVPLSFLDPTGRWPILNISLSYVPLETHAALGREIAAAAADIGRRIAFIASGDCSHRLTHDAPAGFSPQGEELDRTMAGLIDESDFAGLTQIDPALAEAGGECGLRSFVTLGGVTEPAHAQVLAYEAPFGVGYLTAIVNEEAIEMAPPPTPTPDAGDKGGAPGLDATEIVALARQTIETYVRDGERIDAPSLADPDLPARAGAFVSLHSQGQLRGCIGTIGPVTDSLTEEVVRNAIQAASSDPRFPPVGPDELGDLDIKVDVLHPPEPAELSDLDPATYGVIVTSGMRRGLLLPDLEGVDTVEDQVSIAMRKGQIRADEPVQLERFRVDRYA